MTKRYKCPKCGTWESYVIRRSKRRCKHCKYEWKPGALPLRIPASQWHQFLMLIFRNEPVSEIVRQTGLHWQRIYRALLHVRVVMATDIPPVFRGTVEVDETYVGGQWKNKRLSERVKGAKRGRGTSKHQFLAYYAVTGKSGHRLFQILRPKRYKP